MAELIEMTVLVALTYEDDEGERHQVHGRHNRPVVGMALAEFEAEAGFHAWRLLESNAGYLERTFGPGVLGR